MNNLQSCRTVTNELDTLPPPTPSLPRELVNTIAAFSEVFELEKTHAPLAAVFQLTPTQKDRLMAYAGKESDHLYYVIEQFFQNSRPLAPLSSTLPLSSVTHFSTSTALATGPKCAKSSMLRWNILPCLEFLEKECPNLQSLDLSNIELTEEIFHFVTRFPKLAALSCNNCYHLANDFLRRLQFIPHLTHLSLKYCAMLNDRGAEIIAKCKALESLDLTGPFYFGLSNRGVIHLQVLTKMQYLSLAGCHEIDDEGIELLFPMRDLTSLDLSRLPAITDRSLKALVKHPSLISVKLNFCRRITNNGLEALGNLTSLEVLELEDCDEIDDDGIAFLSSCKNLRHLRLVGCKKITDRTLSMLAHLPKLTHLDFTLCPEITDEGVCALHPLKELTFLSFSNCRKLTNRGVFSLTQHPELTSIDLSHILSITSEGILSLKALKKLRCIHLKGCYGISDEEERELKLELPNLTMD